MSKIPMFLVWKAILKRCENPKVKSYHRYGGRGIAVSEEWHTFENFFRDMGERPEGMSIDQIKKLQPGSEGAISQLIADGLIEGPQAIAGKLLLTLKGRLLADAVVRELSS
jgi:hypothetical protein